MWIENIGIIAIFVTLERNLYFGKLKMITYYGKIQQEYNFGNSKANLEIWLYYILKIYEFYSLLLFIVISPLLIKN